MRDPTKRFLSDVRAASATEYGIGAAIVAAAIFAALPTLNTSLKTLRSDLARGFIVVPSAAIASDEVKVGRIRPPSAVPVEDRSRGGAEYLEHTGSLVRSE